MCISIKFLGDANNAGLGNILWESLSRLRVWQEWLIGKWTCYYQKKERKGCRQGAVVSHSCILIKRKSSDGRHQATTELSNNSASTGKSGVHREISSVFQFVILIETWTDFLVSTILLKFNTDLRNQIKEYFWLLRAMYHFKCDMSCHTNLF